MRTVNKSRVIAVSVAVAGLLLVPTMVSAQADATQPTSAGGCCGKICVPQCCQPNVETSDCIISTDSSGQAVLSRPVSPLKKVVLLAAKKDTPYSMVSLALDLSRQEFVQELPRIPRIRYHCRNCLDSEDPSQIRFA